MDFIAGLPLSKRKSAIMVVVDRLTKYAHFGTLPPNFTTSIMALLFTEVVIKLHGYPNSVISGRDPIFMSKVWKRMNELSGTKLKASTSYHAQTDGKTEVVNHSLEQYLRIFCLGKPTTWSSLLCWVEISYNSQFIESMKMSPFMALYGRKPQTIPLYLSGTVKEPMIDEILTEKVSC